MSSRSLVGLSTGLSFHPLKRRARRRKPTVAEVVYLKRVACNKAKVSAKIRRDRIRAENQVVIQRQQERRIASGEITLEHLEFIEHSSARDRGYGEKRRAAKLRATPKWADFEKMFDIFLEAAVREHRTQIKHHVDHIVPLVSDIVCGLHCEQNLQVLTACENMAKHNYRWPDMP